MSRTQLDNEADSLLRRLHWQQLLCPPNKEETLVAVFASGMATNYQRALDFVTQYFPSNVHGWLIAQDLSTLTDASERPKILRKSPLKVPINGVLYPVCHRALFFKPQTGLMHIKLYLFRFERTLRVCICSSNPTIMSWDFQRENFWIQDFPICANDETGELLPAPKTEFGSYLQDVMQHLRATENCASSFALGAKMVAVDFSNAKAKLVASIPGTWNTDANRFGHMRLREIIREVGWSVANNRDSHIHLQSGSLGTNLDHLPFFDDFLLSLDGASALDVPIDFESNVEESDEEELDRLASNPLIAADSGNRYPSNLSIYHPSAKVGTLNRRLYDRHNVSSMADIHCTVTRWHSDVYPTQCFRELQRRVVEVITFQFSFV